MAEAKQPLTISDKINASAWKKKKIMELLGLYPNKFATKMKYNDWDQAEIKKLKENKVVD